MKKLYLFMAVLLSCLTAIGQKWLSNESELFYVANGERVYMSPDYSSIAVYFKTEPNQQFLEQLTSTVQQKTAQLKSNGPAPSLEVLNGKGLVRISVAGLSTADQQDLLSEIRLTNKGAYAVLPSFNVGGTNMLMTKRVNVGLKSGVDQAALQSVLDKYNASLFKSRLHDSFLTLDVAVLENQLPLIKELNQKGLISWGEPDFKAEIKRYNDPLYQYQWHLNNTGGVDWSGDFNLTAGVDIDAEDAWTVTTGSSGITVAVIDDGMVNHEDYPTLLTGYTPANNGDGSPDYTQDPYHGQPCGGLIFAQHNTVGVKGIAPGVNAFSVNIFASGTTNADVADGIIWAVDQGADVLSNSWGFGSCTANLVPSISNAFSYAATSGRGGLGCVILVAAGNDFQSCVSFPANLSTVTAVGAVNGSGVKANYSNTGSALDITAPSNEFILNNAGQLIAFQSDIVSVDLPGSYGYDGGLYYYEFGGTSAATPITAGVACLVLSVDPSLTKSEVENILYSTAVDYGTSGYDTSYGYGLVNAYQAVLAAGGTASACDLDAPDNFASSAITDSTFVLTWDPVDSAVYYIVTAAGVSDSVTVTTYAVSGLSAGTSYACSVKAYCADGGSGSASSLSVTTTGTNPSVSDVLVSSGFDTGFEGFIDGGSNAYWYSGSGYMATAPFVYVADNTTSSLIYSPTFDASSYEQIYLEFDLQFFQMEGNDAFDVYYYDGTSWIYLGSIGVSDYGNNSVIAVSAAINDTDYTLPSNAQFRFEGEGSSSRDYSFLDNVTITGNSGAAVISSTAKLQSYKSLTATQLSKIDTDSSGPIADVQFDLFPNPVSDLLQIQGISLTAKVKLMTISGQVIDFGTGKSVFDVSKLNGGLYLVQIINDEETVTLKFLKQ